MPDLDMEEYYESDVSDNEESHSKLLSSVSQLDSSQRVKPAQRKEITSEVSEYNLTERDPRKRNVINVNELAKVLHKSSKHGEITEKLRNVTAKSKTLQKPLEKPIQEKIKRTLGFANVKKQLRRWDAIVAKNALKDQIRFPLNDYSVGTQRTGEFIGKFKSPTPLEEEIAKVLKQDQKEETNNEDKEFSLTLEEMLEKRREMASLRAKLSYREAKAQRQSKIKSRKYHKILKREKLRQQLKEFELLQKTDPEAALKKLSELDKTRAQERATLRHRNTGQWAKNLTVRAKYDIETRKVLAEQLQLSRELTRKVNDLDDSDKEESDEVNELNALKVTANLEAANQFEGNPWNLSVSKELQEFVSGYKKYWTEQNKTTAQDSTNKEVEENENVNEEVKENTNEEEEKNENINEEVKENINEEEEKNENVNEEEEKNENVNEEVEKTENINEEVKEIVNEEVEKNENGNVKEEVKKNEVLNTEESGVISENSIKLDRRIQKSKKPTLKKPEKQLKKSKRTTENSGKKTLEKNDTVTIEESDVANEVFKCDTVIQKTPQPNLEKAKLRSKKNIKKLSTLERSKSVIIYPSSGVWIVTPVFEKSDEGVPKKRKGEDIDSLFEELDYRLIENAKVAVAKIKNRLENTKPQKKSSRKNKEKNEEFDLSLKNKTTVERPDLDVGLSEGDDLVLETQPKESSVSLTTAINSSTTDIDPKSFIQVKPKKLKTYLPESITNDDDNTAEKTQVMTIEEAFADDDVIAEFKEMKKETEKSSKIEIETSLPGWGQWGGLGIIPRSKKKSRLVVNVPPRKDKKVDMIINENANPNLTNHMVKEVPYPFKSVEAFEATIRAPIGREWVPETAHWKLIEKPVLTKLGAVIEPMSENAIIRKKKSYKSPYKGKIKNIVNKNT